MANVMRVVVPVLSVLLCACVFKGSDIQQAEPVSILEAVHFPPSRADYDQPPVFLSGEMPENSFVFDREKNTAVLIKGKVIVKFTIKVDGTTEIVDIKGKDACKETSTAAVKGWRFLPAKKDGKAISIDVRLPFVYGRLDAPSVSW